MPPNTFPLALTGAFLTALVLSLVGTYFVRGWATRRGYVDVPDGMRRLHTEPTPNVGGVAVALAITVTFLAWSFVAVPDNSVRPDILAMVLGGLLVFVLGFVDDTRSMKATTKFGFQLLIAAAAFVFGVRILGVSFGDLWTGQLTMIASFIVTTIWIVGTTNAFNLIDGSDGVAGGAALFAALSLGIVFVLYGDPLGALMCAIIAGAALGFLFFNFPPASVFMGDSGSLFLGYTLATLGVITTHKTSTLVAVVVPIIAFGVPLLDTTITVVRRFLRHEPIFAADRGHIHHRLRDLGLSPRAVAVVLYVACGGCASLSLLLAAPGRETALPVFVVAGAVLILGVQRLRVPELTELRRAVGRGFDQRSVISHNVRVRVAAHGLDEAASLTEAIDALETAFEDSEFSRIDVMLPEGAGSELDDPRVSVDGNGTRVSIAYENVLHPEQDLELRIPILREGVPVGAFSLHRSSSGKQLFTDVRLVADLLGPAMAEHLARLAKGRSREESQA